MTTSPSPERPLRADAARNRQRILDAAAIVFADRGLDVSLDDIAAAAGVGVGTVYRRFPDKDALIDALFEDKISEVVAIAEAAFEIEDPLEALRTFVLRIWEVQARDRGLKEALHSRDRGSGVTVSGRARIGPVVTKLFARAQEAGVIRADLDASDIPAMNLAIGHIADRLRDVAPDYWKRLATILFDGMVAAPEHCTPLLAAPLTPDELDAAMRSKRC